MSIPHNPIVPSLDDVKYDGEQFTKTNDKDSTILFDPVIKSGIIYFEVLNVGKLRGLGIAEESVHYERGQEPRDAGKEKVVGYRYDGRLHHIGNFIHGNYRITDGHHLGMELNMDSNPRTLTYFLDGSEQNMYATNIPASVRVWANIMFKGSSFAVSKFESLSSPKAKHGSGTVGYQYGSEWSEGSCFIL